MMFWWVWTAAGSIWDGPQRNTTTLGSTRNTVDAMSQTKSQAYEGNIPEGMALETECVLEF
jgi:hypothetical protein